jgi:hypothetical protein
MVPNKVEIAVLRDVTNRIFDFIEKELKMKSIELPNILYWDIPSEQMYDMTEKPTETSCGSLADDYEFILSSFKSRSEAVPLELIHVAPLLSAIARAVPSYRSPPEQ